ncbi:MAG: transcriptional regulator NrdR [Candidatus Woesearchaeota archaeon]
MKCPYCGSNEHKVTDKRETPDETATRRRRECLKCGKRFTTYERVEEVELIVIKKDGKRVSFDRQNVLKGIQVSCHKRPISYDQMVAIVDEVEAKLRNMDSVEIPSKKIGNMVMRQLRKLDKVAFIRFASVYREFSDIDEFAQELDKIIKK